jgi:hypothetical protein
MKIKSILFFASAVMLLSSCRQIHSSTISSVQDNYGINQETKFEYLGTMGLAMSPNVLFADMLKAAREKYGSDVSITNIRSRVNNKSFVGLKFGFQEEVLFDVYKKK